MLIWGGESPLLHTSDTAKERWWKRIGRGPENQSGSHLASQHSGDTNNCRLLRCVSLGLCSLRDCRTSDHNNRGIYSCLNRGGVHKSVQPTREIHVHSGEYQLFLCVLYSQQGSVHIKCADTLLQLQPLFSFCLIVWQNIHSALQYLPQGISYAFLHLGTFDGAC